MKVSEIGEQIRTLGRPASWYEALVTTRADERSLLEISRELPDLESCLVICGPGESPVHTSSGDPEISFCKAGGEASGYSASAYFSVMQFLLERNHRLDKTLFFLPGADPAVKRALLDIQWFQSSMMVRLLAQTGNVNESFIKWAQLLLNSAQPLQALQFAHLMRSKLPQEKLSQLALSALLEMDCADPLTLSWLESLPSEKGLRNRTRKKVKEAIVTQRARAKEQLDSNLEVLEARWPKSSKLIRDSQVNGICTGILPELPWLLDLKTGVVDRASYPVFFRRTGGIFPVLNPPHDPRGLIPGEQLLQYTRQVPGIVLGSLMAFDAIANLTMNRLAPQMANMQQPIYLVEKDPELARLVLSHVDLSSVLDEERIVCFFGPSAVQDLEERFEGNSRLLLPAMRVCSDDHMDAALDGVLRRRNASIQTYSSAWEKLYPPDFSCQAYEAFFERSQDKPRVLVVTSLFSTVVQYVARDLGQAFSELGADVHVLKEKTGIERCDTRVLAQEIFEYHPHLLVVIDHLRPEYQGMVPDNLPWVSWNQDPLPGLFDSENISKLGDYDFSYSVSGLWREQFQGLGYKHIEMLPFAANTGIYHPVDSAFEVRDEIAFITNMDIAQDFFPSFPGLQEKLEEQFDSQDISYANPELMSERILQALGRHPGEDELKALANTATWRFERWYDRRRVLRWLLDSGFPVGLYGRGWEADSEFAPMARGWIEQGQDLAELYRKSRAVIHVNTLINTHQRVFECLASGGFVLARRTPYDDSPGELRSCLKAGKEIELFGSARELGEKLSRVFTDNEWRQGLIEAGRRRVLGEHTYLARVRTILDDLKARLKHQKARAA